MLVQLLLQQPQQLGTVVLRTPPWVWGLLAGLVAFGAAQLRDRRAGVARTALVPLGMLAFSAWGLAGAFGGSPVAAGAFGTWLATTVAVTAAVAPGRTAARYEPATRSWQLPGSAVPLLLIVGIFLTKWAVGVELAMQPAQAADPSFALPVAAVYGAFNGVFAGRAARLWRLAARPAPVPAS